MVKHLVLKNKVVNPFWTNWTVVMVFAIPIDAIVRDSILLRFINLVAPTVKYH
jgi:hypothetical protein